MCTCLRDTKEKLTAHIQEQNPEWKITDSGFEHAAYFHHLGATVPTFPFYADYTTLTKKGLPVKKTFKTNLMPGYCPFCGVKFENSGGVKLDDVTKWDSEGLKQ